MPKTKFDETEEEAGKQQELTLFGRTACRHKMNANRTTSAHNIVDSWGGDGFIKARNSRTHTTGDATLRIEPASILSTAELFVQAKARISHLIERTSKSAQQNNRLQWDVFGYQCRSDL